MGLVAPPGPALPLPPAMNIYETAKGDPNKIFIGGLPKECGVFEVRDYFEQYGETEDVLVPESSSGICCGFAIVRFSTSAPVDIVIQDYAVHKLLDKWVEVKRVDGNTVPSERKRSLDTNAQAAWLWS